MMEERGSKGWSRPRLCRFANPARRTVAGLTQGKSERGARAGLRRGAWWEVVCTEGLFEVVGGVELTEARAGCAHDGGERKVGLALASAALLTLRAGLWLV